MMAAHLVNPPSPIMLNVIPTHLLPESAQTPWGLVPELGLTVSVPAGADELAQLQDLMAVHGLELQATRMVYDRHYALDRLARAHATGDAALQALAQDLFDAYQRRGEWIGLVH